MTDNPPDAMPKTFFEQRNDMLIKMIVDCGYGDLPVEEAVKTITKAIRKSRRMK